MAGTSRIAFGPAQTTAIGVRPSSSRSDEMSNVGSARRRSPARRARHDGRHRSHRSRRRAIPAACAAIIVADTVVAAHPPPAERRGEARSGRLAHRAGRCRGQREQRGLVEADEQPAVVDRHRRRDRPGRPDRSLRGGRDLEVLGIRQAVADQRRFERHDRPALGQRGRDLGIDGESVGERGGSWHRRSLQPRGRVTAAYRGRRRPSAAPSRTPCGRRRTLAARHGTRRRLAALLTPAGMTRSLTSAVSDALPAHSRSI